jgi:gluconolactonase
MTTNTTGAVEGRIAPVGAVERIAGDCIFTEGPIWVSDGYLLFSDIPADSLVRWHPREGKSIVRGSSSGVVGRGSRFVSGGLRERPCI